MSESPAFGAFPPSPFEDYIRRLAHRLPYSYWGRKTASMLLGLAGGRQTAPKDVTVFNTQKARLHPYDNIAEKRVYLTPNHWDPEERRHLQSFIEKQRQSNFTFIDIGANAGLYTLFARSCAQESNKEFCGLCIEPDDIMVKRLMFNLNASDAHNDVTVIAAAAASTDGSVTFSTNSQSRGMSRIDPDGDKHVRATSLHKAIKENRLSSIDALKIDIEGYETAVMGSFFKQAPRALFPRLIIMETSHQKKNGQSSFNIKDLGYRAVYQNSLNAIFERS